MVKLVCDRCGKVLEGPMYFKLEVTKPSLMRMKHWGIPNTYDLCPECMEDLDKFLGVARKTESIKESDVAYERSRK